MLDGLQIRPTKILTLISSPVRSSGRRGRTHSRSRPADRTYFGGEREPFRDKRGISRVVNTNLPDHIEILRRAQQGDVAAFGQLAELHAEPLWYCARALCHDDHDAEDLAQETLVEAWRSLRRFDGRCRFSTWLYGILRHRFLKSRRKPRPLAGAEAADEQLSREVLPVAAAAQAEDARLVQVALAALPDEHRAVLELRFFAGAALEEIAAVLGCPLGTVKSRLHHGLEKLRRAKITVNLFADAGESSSSDT